MSKRYHSCNRPPIHVISGQTRDKRYSKLVYDAASEYPNLNVEVTEPLGLDDGIINVIKSAAEFINVFK